MFHLTQPTKCVMCIAHDRTHVIFLLIIGAKPFPFKKTSKLPLRCIDNIVMFYIRCSWRMLYIYYNIIVIEIY